MKKTCKFLREIKDNDLIFIDTCSIINPEYKQFEMEFFDGYSTLCIDFSVMKELLILNERKDSGLQESTRYALSSIEKYKKSGHLRIFNYSKKIYYKKRIHADKEILKLLTGLRSDTNVCIITQDRNLTHDLLSMKNVKSCKICNISVYKFAPEVFLGKAISSHVVDGETKAIIKYEWDKEYLHSKDERKLLGCNSKESKNNDETGSWDKSKWDKFEKDSNSYDDSIILKIKKYGKTTVFGALSIMCTIISVYLDGVLSETAEDLSHFFRSKMDES